jgi:hypothetical protein
MDIIGEEGKPTVVNAPKPVESPPIITNLVVALRSKERKNATAPSIKSGSIGEMKIASSPSTTMIMASNTLSGISCNAGPNLPSNHKSLRRTNAPTKGLASAMAAIASEYSSDKYRRSISIISLGLANRLLLDLDIAVYNSC